MCLDDKIHTMRHTIVWNIYLAITLMHIFCICCLYCWLDSNLSISHTSAISLCLHELNMHSHVLFSALQKC